MLKFFIDVNVYIIVIEINNNIVYIVNIIYYLNIIN